MTTPVPRVLLVAQQLRRAAPGGIGTYIGGLVAGVAGRADVSLLAGRAPKNDGGRLDIHVASALPGRLLTRTWDLGLVAAPAGYDVVHAASLAAPASSSAPLVTAIHDLAWRVVPDAFPTRGRRWHEAALRRARRRASVLVVPTAATADALRTMGVPSSQIEVLSPMYGADHLPAPDVDGAAALLGRLGVPGPYLLTVGTREPRKNLFRLMEAYARARSSLPEPWPLVVVGPPGWGGSLGQAGPPLPPGVLLTGTVSDAVLAALYRGARCLAYVPLFEGFGLPALEAMTAGIPVVASPIPSTGSAALTVDPLDLGAIAAALLQASSSEARRVELIEAGRRHTERFRWVDAASGHLDLWKALA